MKRIKLNFIIASMLTLIVLCTWSYLDTNENFGSNMYELYRILENQTLREDGTKNSVFSTDAATAISLINIAKDITITTQPVGMAPTTVNRTKNVFYNRVGKCGSRSFWNVIKTLSKRGNEFGFDASEDYRNEWPPPPDAYREMLKIVALQYPTIYNRHIYYLDFKKYGFEPPIYINMLRDPIKRYSSQYNYNKYGDVSSKNKTLYSDWHDINECVMQELHPCNTVRFQFHIGLYFCGVEDVCKNETIRVEIAKKHIDEEYLMIGMIEEFENTLLLFEKMLPQYFHNATNVWKETKEESQTITKTKSKDFLTEEAIEHLRKHSLADEIEVYRHAKRKFDQLKKEYGIS